MSFRYLICAFILLSQPLFAREGLNFKIHHHYVTPRALGMGDAFIAATDDYSALFYNPAALARRKNGEVNLSLGAGASPALQDLFKDVQDASKLQGTESEKVTAISNVLDKAYGKTYNLRAQLLEGIWVRPGWGFGVLPMDLSLDFSVNRQLGPALNAYVIGDTTVAYGWATDVNWIPKTRTSVGVTGKFVHRVAFDQSISAFDLAQDSKIISNDDLYEGNTVDADIGFLITPEIPEEGFFSLLKWTQPSFAMVVRNVAEVGFQKSKMINKEVTEKPEKMHRVIDVGSKWEYPNFWIFGGRGTLDVRDIMHPNFNIRKGLHLGFEFDWTVTSWWKGHYRVGLNQMYLSGGVSAMLGWFNLDLVTYAEDVGTYSKPKENRIYMAKLNMNF